MVFMCRIPEERLVCLAQTMGNVEFFGCQYPEETMKEVETISSPSLTCLLDLFGLL
jgi:hypothetical protein